MHKQIIAVDFDGTLCENKWPEIGEPNTELIGYLIMMQKTVGAKIILWTCRIGEMLDRAVNWCSEHGLEFDAVNENLPHIIERFGSDTRKIFANMYIVYRDFPSKNGITKHAVIFGDGSSLMKRLRNAGTDHRKFMRMIVVYLDITAPLYWWKEFDTYKVGTVANSCSTMHKIAEKEFTLEDFSYNHLIDYDLYSCNEVDEPVINEAPHISCGGIHLLNLTINVLNYYRNKYLETKDKKYWWQIIQLLPSSYNQKRTVMLNYEVLANIHKGRRNHKLDEWHTFCNWIEELPYSELITGYEENEK